ncbi:hypothetical protein ACM9HF_03620 [Colwellia sp. RE-S-Sl-9]
MSFANIGKQVEDAYVYRYQDKYHMIMRDMGVIYPLSFKMQVSVGTKNNLGEALSLRHGYSLTKVNNEA